MGKPAPPNFLRSGVAELLVAFATAIAWLLPLEWGAPSRYLPLSLAVLVGAGYGGLRPGLLATLLGAAAGWFLSHPLALPTWACSRCSFS
jgi:uncharacterized protein DUF4118